ncbi:NfeD family protein [Candidatus Contubernalis alkaliaceticus]|uniref:NfeD family protein n=1 Tax=Candidatus Contubernalis alkaliaceticus TaxID=338645 RepID=UPI001F4C08E1|nr:NfeD family protein [Candidatus Contubernalis alkalaceticus]UNC93134.1 nodulation protein NfeD [Candidatus Contubernalis alkalaceticus]
MVRRKGLIVAVFLLLLSFSSLLMAAEEMVYFVPVRDAVEHSLKIFLDRSFKEAEQNNASAVILEFNTPGGRVDAAQEIKDLILQTEVPVYAYVRPQAVSAGAYLAMACDRLYMSPGSTIGAAELRQGITSEEVTDEKLLSNWEAEMRTVAELRGRDPEIAAAMARREISIPDVVNSGQLLTLTTGQAQSLGFIDGVFNSRAELLEHLGLEDAQVINKQMSSAERLARFVTHPVTSTILLTIAFAALIIEILTAGFGVGGSISILAFTLFFGGHIIAGLAGYEVVILFLMGILLLLTEAFIAGFGILGLAGIGSLIASILLSAAETGEMVTNLVIALILSSIIIGVSLRYLVKSKFLSNIILSFKEDKDLGYVGPQQAFQLLDKEGITLTPLRPSGTAEFDGSRIDVVSEGGFIDVNLTVKVVQVDGPRVIVRELKK